MAGRFMADRLGDPDYARDGASVSGNRSPRVDEREPDPYGADHWQVPYWEVPGPRQSDRVIARRPGILAPMKSDSQVVQRDAGHARAIQPQQVPKRSSSLPPQGRKPRGGERTERNSRSTRSPRRKPAERRNEANRDREPPKQADPTRHGEFETVYNSIDARDVTVHLELDVTADFDEELEEFNRLSRLGDFRGAKTFFDQSLKSHVNSPAIFVQYAEMLLEMGDYRSINRLNADQVFSRLKHDTDKNDVRLRMLHLNWKLVKAVALSCTQHELPPIWNELGPPVDLFPMKKDVDSTDIRILCLAIRLTQTTRIKNAVSRSTKTARCADWADWKKIYEQLLIQGRIWDFRDVLVTLVTYFSMEQALRAFFEPASAVEVLMKDWTVDEPDESTQLALLDILSFLAISACSSSEVKPLAESYLDIADSIGESILQNFPDDVNSRPFLQWVIAKAAITARRGKRSPLSFDYLADYPGQAVLPKRIGIPYYIPVRQENPGWVAPQLPPKSLEPLEMALKAARELGDYQTQAVCLKELIIRSKAPTALFDELSSLQKSTQQNMDGYLATCLSKYLLCKGEESKRKLRAELADFGWWEEPSAVVSPFRAATRDVLMRALSPIDVEYIPNSIKAGVKYYKSLPAFFQRLIDQHAPLESGRNRGTGATPTSAPGDLRPDRGPPSPPPPPVIVLEKETPPTPPHPAPLTSGQPDRISQEVIEDPVQEYDEGPETKAVVKQTGGDTDIEVEEIRRDFPGPPPPAPKIEFAEPTVDPSYTHDPPVHDIYDDRRRSRADERDKLQEDYYYDRESRNRYDSSPDREDGSGSENNWNRAKSLALVAADRFAGSFADKAATRLKSWEEKMEKEPESPVEYEIPRHRSRSRSRARARARSRSRSGSRDRSADSNGRRRRDKTSRNIATGLALVAAGALAGGLAQYRERRKQREKDKLEYEDDVTYRERRRRDSSKDGRGYGDTTDRRYPTREERRRNRLRQEEIRERRERRKQRKRESSDSDSSSSDEEVAKEKGKGKAAGESVPAEKPATAAPPNRGPPPPLPPRMPVPHPRVVEVVDEDAVAQPKGIADQNGVDSKSAPDASTSLDNAEVNPDPNYRGGLGETGPASEIIENPEAQTGKDSELCDSTVHGDSVPQCRCSTGVVVTK